MTTPDCTRFLGGYLSVLSVPKSLVEPGEMVGHVGVGRFAGIYTADHLDDARAVFLFRSKEELDYDHRDALRQKELLRDAFAGMHEQVDGWLDGTRAHAHVLLRLDHPAALDTLVAPPGHPGRRRRDTAPGPRWAAAPASPSSAPTCWPENSPEADGDHLRAFAAYELQMREPVQPQPDLRSRRRQGHHPRFTKLESGR